LRSFLAIVIVPLAGDRACAASTERGKTRQQHYERSLVHPKERVMRNFGIGLLILAGCSSPSSTTHFANGFDPAPTPAGYTRYVTPIVPNIQPGQDIVLCQWLATASDAEIDIADVGGFQSRGGHHAVLYSSTNLKETVGSSRECTPLDTEGVQFMGAIGGEGTARVTLPAGMVFRLPKGRSLMANVHYINAGTNAFDGQSVLDVKYAAVSPTSKVAAMLVVNQGAFSIPPQQSYSIDGYCTAPKDLSLIMFTDHMHEWGRSIFNELVRADGSRLMLASDDAWTRDLIFNPRWNRWDVASPLVVKAGDQFHVHCQWQGGAKPLHFPDEMCIGLGFFLEGGDQLVCLSK
jgi:hypothetical protein